MFEGGRWKRGVSLWQLINSGTAGDKKVTSLSWASFSVCTGRALGQLPKAPPAFPSVHLHSGARASARPWQRGCVRPGARTGGCAGRSGRSGCCRQPLAGRLAGNSQEHSEKMHTSLFSYPRPG